MKIKVFVTSGSYEYWKGVMERAGSELGFAFFMELGDLMVSSAAFWSLMALKIF